MAFLLLLISLAYAPGSYGQIGKTEVDFEVLDVVEIKEDHNLSELAEKYYGDSDLWRLIKNLNKISDPTRIPIGTTIYIPVYIPVSKSKESISAAAETESVDAAETPKGEFGVSFMLAKGDLDKLKKEIKSDQILEELKKLTEQGVEYLFKDQFVSNLEASEVLEQYRYIIAEQAKKWHEFDESKEIKWSGKPRGCKRNFGDKVVYGFYPFWMADGEAQKLDFSVLSRIAYFAVPFDSSGSISKRLDLTSERAKFMKEAWRHGTAVDLVIYQNNWPEGGTESMLDGMATEIDDLLNTKIERNFSDWIKYCITFGRYKLPTMGDGVTIFFDGFPHADSDLFTEFIKILRTKLDKDKPDKDKPDIYKGKYLNIMLNMDEIGEYVISEGEGGGSYVDNVNLFLVFLNEPTKDSKKALRKNIEDELSGLLRRNMLRKIVPVIFPTNANSDEKQFYDDLIYFQDNFRGVGFWPLPINKDDESNIVSEKVVKVFKVKSHETFQKILSKTGIRSGYNQVSDIVCPNKWWLRVAFNMLAAIILVYGVLCIWFFELRVFFRKHYKYFLLDIIPLIIVAVVSLVWDPFWNSKRDEVFVLLIFVFFIVGIVKFVDNMRRANYP